MSVPKFTAERSIYFSSRNYARTKTPNRTPISFSGPAILPSMTCTGPLCGCIGDDDCNNMFSNGNCSNIAACYEDIGVCLCLTK